MYRIGQRPKTYSPILLVDQFANQQGSFSFFLSLSPSIPFSLIQVIFKALNYPEKRKICEHVDSPYQNLANETAQNFTYKWTNIQYKLQIRIASAIY